MERSTPLEERPYRETSGIVVCGYHGALSIKRVYVLGMEETSAPRVMCDESEEVKRPGSGRRDICSRDRQVCQERESTA